MNSDEKKIKKCRIENFYLSFNFAQGINEQSISANYEHGLLKIKLEKTTESNHMAKSIDIT